MKNVFVGQKLFGIVTAIILVVSTHISVALSETEVLGIDEEEYAVVESECVDPECDVIELLLEESSEELSEVAIEEVLAPLDLKEELFAPDEITDEVVSANGMLGNATQGSYGVDLSSEGYVTNINPLYKKGYWGECTWYCWGRAYEKCNQIRLSWSNNDTFGNAKDWYNNAQSWSRNHNVDYSVGTEPRENSIAVYTGGDVGHVVFIERIADGYAYYSESNGAAGHHTYGEGRFLLSELPYSGYIYMRRPVASGQCGENVYWDLYEDKVLEIHGSGAMWDYYPEDAPWKSYSWNEEYEVEYHVGHVNIEKVIIQEGVTSIGAGAFAHMYMNSVSIPDTVNQLGSYAFMSCENLSEIDLPDSVLTIPGEAFAYCSKLRRVKLPAKLTIIEEGAFYETRLASIDLPDSLIEIRGDAFGRSSLKKVHITENVSLVDSWAFWECNLTQITVDKKNKDYVAANNVLYTKEKDMLVLCAACKEGTFSVPDGIKYIGAAAFSGTKLSEIVLPDGVLTIGTYAFEAAYDLRSVNLPASLVSIDEHVFIYSDYGGTLDKLTVYVEYGSYAHKYCRAHDLKHPTVEAPEEEGFLKNYIVTKNLTKAGSNGTISLNKGEKLQLTPVGSNGNLTIKSCKTRNSKIAKINKKGVVTAVAKGKTKITIQPKSAKAMTLTVKISDPYTPTGIKLNKTGTVKLAIGKTLQLHTTLSPTTAETTLTWSTSNSRIAKVSKSGIVTAVKKGTATITVKTKNGKKAKVKIKVINGSGGGW